MDEGIFTEPNHYQISSEKNEDEIDEIDTGTLSDESSTYFSIMDGFLSHEDYIVFLTLDVSANEIYVEVFQFANS